MISLRFRIFQHDGVQSNLVSHQEKAPAANYVWLVRVRIPLTDLHVEIERTE